MKIGEELKSTGFINKETIMGENEDLNTTNEVPDSNELNEKVFSSESNEQPKEVESIFKGDLMKMATGKQPLTKGFIIKLRSGPKKTSTSDHENEMNIEENFVSLRDDANISLMPSSEPILPERNPSPRILKAARVKESILSKRNLRPRILKGTQVEDQPVSSDVKEIKAGPSKSSIEVQKGKSTLREKMEKKMKMSMGVIEEKDEAVQVLRTRSSLQLYLAMKDFQTKQRKAVVAMGLKSLLHLSIEYLPSRLGFYVVDHFDDERMVLKLLVGELEITKDTVKQILGFPIGEIHKTQREQVPMMRL